MASIDVSTGMTLEYDIRGEGEPLLFVMGLAGQLVDWHEEFVDLFADEGFMTIRFDNRDVGLSTKTEERPPAIPELLAARAEGRPMEVPYTVSDQAADAVAVLLSLIHI